MTSEKVKSLLVENYSGASCETIDKNLTVILKDVKRVEKLLYRISVSIRNGGHDSKSEFGKIYTDIQKELNK